MKKVIYSMLFMIAVILALSISTYANTDNSYLNGTDTYSDGVVEFYSNIDDEDKLYKVDLSDMTEEKVLNEHIISMVNKDQYLYLLTYEAEKSNLLKFNMQDNSVSIEKSFDGFVTNIALRDSILYYVDEQNIFTYNLQTKENSIFIENENVDFIYFTDRNTLKFLVKNGSNYDTKIYDFNAVVVEQNEVSLFSLQGESEISLMSVSSYTPRLSAPSPTNSYYIHTSYGGLNECIHISGGSVLPNCVGYAWGRSYENLGYRPNLSKGDAGTWYDYNRNNGYYSHGKTPYLGAVAVWKKTGGAGHVAVVEVIDGDVVITSESGYNSSRWWKTTRSASNSNFSASSSYIFQGFIYVCGTNASVNTEPPSSPENIRSNKNVYNSSESITFYWDAVANATNYWIYLWKDGVQLYGTDMGMSTSYTSAPTSPGEYTLIVRAGNNIGYSNGGIPYQFTVTDAIPQPVTNMWSDKSEYKPGDDITFYWNKAEGAQEYWVYLWKDGSQLSTTCVGSNTHYSTTLNGSGKYTLIIRPCNINGFNESSVSHSVQAVSSGFSVHSDRNVYKSSEYIEFSWSLVNGATNYWVYLWKDGVQLYGTDMGTNTSYSSAPTSSGKYTLIVRAIANNSEYAANSYSFIVTDSIPQPVSNMWSDKEEYVPYDSITFSWDEAYGTQDYWVYLWKDGIQLSYDCVGNRTNYTTTLIDSGKYTLVIRPSNVNGFNEGSVSCTIKAGLYDVIYNDNITDEIHSKQTKFFNEHLYLNEEIPKLDGYVFVCWNTKSDGSGRAYNPGDVYTENEDLTLYAQWEKAIPYTESIVTKSGATFIIDTKAHNITAPYDILIVGYKENRLVTMKRVPHDEQNSPYTLEGDIDEIKVMVWDGLSTLKPLCEAEVIPDSKWIME